MSAMWRRVLPSVPVYQIAERITDYSCDQQGGDGLLRGKIAYVLSCLRALLVEIARRFAGAGRYTLDKLACSVHRLPAGLGGAVGCVLSNGFSLVDQGSSLCPSPPTGFVRLLGCLPTGVFRNLLRPFLIHFLLRRGMLSLRTASWARRFLQARAAGLAAWAGRAIDEPALIFINSAV